MDYHFDLKALRANPAAFDAALARRGIAPQSEGLLALDAERRSNLTSAQETKSSAKTLSREIGIAIKTGDLAKADQLKRTALHLNDTADHHEAHAQSAESRLMEAMIALPNAPASDVPSGVGEDDNVEVSRWGGPGARDGRPHDAMNFNFGFETAAMISGARFSMLSGSVARLHRALGQWMLDEQIKRGYKEVIPPTIVKSSALYGTGQLPKFKDDLFALGADSEADPKYLIPTAEVPLTNMFRGDLLVEGTMRFAALTDCYRAEAGSAGRDTRGLIRQHQFQKVELVTICEPKNSEEEHERMVDAAESILRLLNLPFRRMLLCTGDMGFSAAKTYDLEVWLPGQNTYREISSISNCRDFQARRMNTRYLIKAGETEFAHTLNGSGLAVGRTLVAVMENYYCQGYNHSDDVVIPEVLRPYMLSCTMLSQLDEL